MKQIKWTGPDQEWPAQKIVLREGTLAFVEDSVADSWIASGHAEVVRDAKPRRVAAPESAQKE